MVAGTCLLRAKRFARKGGRRTVGSTVDVILSVVTPFPGCTCSLRSTMPDTVVTSG